jgi:hypothetical protein
LAAIRAGGDVLPRYVLYALRNSAGVLEAQATGSTFAAITGTQLKAHTIPVAPLGEQRRIVDAIEANLSRLDAGVDSLRRAKRNLERMQVAALDSVFKRVAGSSSKKPIAEVADILDSRRIPVNAEERAQRRGDVPYFGATGQVGWIDEPLFDEPLVLLGEDGAPFLDPFRSKAYLISGPSWVNNPGSDAAN